MPTFDYTADDDHGRPAAGRISAPTWSVAQDALRHRGWIVRTLQVASEAAASGGRDLNVTTVPVSAESAQPHVSLVLSLYALGEEMPTSRARDAVSGIARRIEQGQSLDAAVQAESDRLPLDLRNLMLIGLPTGRVDFLINDYLEHCRRNADLRRSFRVSLAYPIALFAILGGILVFLIAGIVPMFSHIFGDFGIELPKLTQLLLGMSHVMVHDWPLLLIAIVVLPLTVYGIIRLAGGPGGPQAAWRAVPVIGQGFRWASLSNFCHLLATLMELNVPLPQALRAAADVNDDRSLAERVRRAAAAIERGESPRDVIARRGHWVSELGAAFHWAGRSDQFVESLRASGEVFSARSRVQTNLVLWVFEPVLLVALAVSVGLIVLALFLPLLTLLNNLA